MTESDWAVAPPTDEEVAEVAAERYEANFGEVEREQREQDAAAGLSEAESEELNGPPQYTSHIKAFDRLPYIDDEGHVDEASRYREPATQEQAAAEKTAEGPDIGTVQDVELDEAVRDQVAPVIDAEVDDLLVNMGAEFDSAELNAATKQAEQLFSITNPNYPQRKAAAEYLSTRQAAGQLEAAGYTKSNAWKTAKVGVGKELAAADLFAVTNGLDQAEVRDGLYMKALARVGTSNANPSANEIFREGMAAAKSTGEQTAATIAAGEKAAKTLGKGGGGATVKGGVMTEQEISEITDPVEHARAYEAWFARETGTSHGWAA